MLGRQYRVEGFGTGCIPNPVDDRDVCFSLDELCYDDSELPEAGGFDPDDLAEHLIQGGTPLCVLFAIAHAVQFVELLAGLPYRPISKLGPHWYVRKLRGREKHVEGGHIRDGMRVMQKRGAEDESAWPFSENPLRIIKRPDNIACELSAHKRAGGTYKHIKTLDMEERIAMMKAILAAHGKTKRPIIFGAGIGSSFARAWKAGHEAAPFVESEEAIRGYHAMVVIAYRVINSVLHFLVLNSWSGRKCIWVPAWSFQAYDVFDLTVYDGWTELRKALS